MKHRIFLDSFIGALADLKPRERTTENALGVLSRSPRVSTWDMSECAWVRHLIGDLKHRGLIEEADEPYPWHRYALTDAGRAALPANAEVSGAGTASAGLPGYAGDGNGERND